VAEVATEASADVDTVYAEGLLKVCALPAGVGEHDHATALITDYLLTDRQPAGFVSVVHDLRIGETTLAAVVAEEAWAQCRRGVGYDSPRIAAMA
jgi:hypothetical protein